MKRTIKRLFSKPKKTWIVRKLTSCILVLALLGAHHSPGRLVYHCLVSGAYLPECCCKGDSSCYGGTASSSEVMPCCLKGKKSSMRGDDPPTGTGFTKSSCGCCDIVFQEGTPSPLALKSTETDRPGTRKAFPFSVALPLSHQSVSLVPTSSHASRWTRLKCPHKGPPLYILHSSFLC